MKHSINRPQLIYCQQTVKRLIQKAARQTITAYNHPGRYISYSNTKQTSVRYIIVLTASTPFRNPLHYKKTQFSMRRSRWPRGLRRGYEAARLLGLRVRIPWMSVSCECCVPSNRHPRAKPIPRPEECYRGWPRPEKRCWATKKKVPL
jgi:hypothetical protein